jgi:hypothetical protein
MTDKITKLLLAAIAAGLWANVAASPARAQADPWLSIARDVSAIASGTCANQSLCSTLMRR